MMKKCMIFVLVAALLLCLTSPAFAAGSSVSLTTSAITLHRGESFTVSAWLSGGKIAALGTVKLSFDTDAFILTGGSCHIADTSIGQVIPAKYAGTFLLKGDSRRIAGKLFTFTLTVAADAPLGSYTITSATAMGETSGSAIASGSITVSVTDSCDHVFSGANCSLCGCPQPPTAESVTHDSVTLKAVEGHLYSKDGLNWQESPEFTGLLPNTPYNFYLRYGNTAGGGLSLQTKFLPGDTNGDDSTDNDDVLQLLWNLLFGSDYTLCAGGDVDHNGLINNDDVLYLLWHILFGDDYPI